MAQPGFEYNPGPYQSTPVQYQPVPPKNPLFRKNTWIAALVAPLVAFAVAYLVALLCVLITPDSANLNAELGNMAPQIDSLSVSPFVSGILYVLMALGASYGGTVTISGDLSAITGGLGLPFSTSEYTIRFGLHLVPLTLTALVVLVLFMWHRRESAKAPSGPARVLLPALVSGGVLAMIGALTSLLSSVNMTNLLEKLGLANMGLDLDLQMSLHIPVLHAILGGFILGFVAAAVGRVAGMKLKDRASAGVKPAAALPTFAHALKIAFAFFTLATLAVAVYLVIYALTRDSLSVSGDELPTNVFTIRTALSMIPLAMTAGIAAIVGSMGGFGTAGYTAPSIITGGAPGDSVRAQLFSDVPFSIWASGFLALIVLVLIAIWWGRIQAAGTGRSFLSWVYLPAAFTLMGALVIYLSTLSANASFSGISTMKGMSFGAYARISWLMLFWFLGLGVIAELISRIFRPKAVPGMYDGVAPYGAPYAPYGYAPQVNGYTQPGSYPHYSQPTPYDGAQPGPYAPAPSGPYAPAPYQNAPYSPEGTYRGEETLPENPAAPEQGGHA